MKYKSNSQLRQEHHAILERLGRAEEQKDTEAENAIGEELQTWLMDNRLDFLDNDLEVRAVVEKADPDPQETEPYPGDREAGTDTWYSNLQPEEHKWSLQEALKEIGRRGGLAAGRKMTPEQRKARSAKGIAGKAAKRAQRQNSAL